MVFRPARGGGIRIWLYEIEPARSPYAMMKYDSSDAISKQMFDEDWARYVMKLATGAGKTKVMSLLMTWSYFHKLYELDSPLSTNFLLIAPLNAFAEAEAAFEVT